MSKCKKIQCQNNRTWTVGAPKWISTSALARQVTWLEYWIQTNVGSFEEESEKQIPSTSISTAIGRCSDIQLKTVQMLYESVVRRLEALLKASGGQTPSFPCVGIISSNRHQDSLSVLSFLVVCNLSSTVKPIHLFSNIVLVKSCSASSSKYIFLVFTVRSSWAQDVYASICVWENSVR